MYVNSCPHNLQVIQSDTITFLTNHGPNVFYQPNNMWKEKLKFKGTMHLCHSKKLKNEHIVHVAHVFL